MPKKRNKPNLPLPNTLNIFCEGAKTEPYYLNGYLEAFRQENRLRVVEVQKTNKNTPVQLVDEAVKLKNSNESLDGDKFWVVYDRESTSKYSNDLHAKAWSKASNNNIEIAITNVCFEQWILLHFIDSATQYSSFDDLKNKSNLFSEFKKISGKEFSKSTKDLFLHVKGSIELARERAKKINKAGVEAAKHNTMPYDINPYIGIPYLLDAIDQF